MANQNFAIVAIILAFVLFPTFCLASYSSGENWDNPTLADTSVSHEYELELNEPIEIPEKRFFPYHPKDYKPMRKFGPVGRGTKRETDEVYHPIPRAITFGMQNIGNFPTADTIEGGDRQKRQTRAALLLYRLRSRRMQRKNSDAQRRDSRQLV